jgi:hypothetical protein
MVSWQNMHLARKAWPLGLGKIELFAPGAKAGPFHGLTRFPGATIFSSLLG